MKRPRGKSSQKGAIELIEEAVHLLRQAPLPTLAAYYIGALPFVIGLLYFWADMGRSPFAGQHLAGATLGVAALFLWMKFWQSVFTLNLRALMAGQPPPPSAFRDALRQDGWRWLLVELAAMVVFGLASMGLDRLRRLQKERAAATMPPVNEPTNPPAPQG